jgi:hypothetical protein
MAAGDAAKLRLDLNQYFLTFTRKKDWINLLLEFSQAMVRGGQG